MSIKLRVTTLAASLMLATGAIYAQQGSYYDNDSSTNSYASDSNYASNAVDPPSRVARLSLLQGAVSFVPAGENDWIQAQANRPLITGDKLWTDRGARAELQIGPAAIRVDAQSSFNFLNLDDRTAQVELTQGTLNIGVRRLYEGQNYEIDTPTLAFVVNRVGEYRIDVAPDGRGTIVTAFRGGGDAYGEGGARFRIEEGQSVRFNDSALRDYESNGVPRADDFDRFCFARDGRWENSPSRQYVSEDVIGYDDLDNNGTWSAEPEYGNVWYPTSVAVGWTPYSYGHWGWVGAYGWTWVDDSPWGFAPFHYGRWAYINSRWGWCPGPVHVRAYYAPALVAFIGGGIRVGVGFNSGPVGWFPLGPRDVYVPGYRVSRDYFTRVNINNTTINNVTINNYYGNYSRGNFDYSRVNYANRNIAGAVTAVPGEAFVGARAIRGSALPVNRDTFANARVSGFAQIAPTRQSLAFEGGRRGDAPPQAALNRNIIAATRPPAPVASFAQREQALQRDPGRALPVSQLRVNPGAEAAGRADARGQGVRTQRGIGERPNVNVVTATGMPARTPAPTIARDAQQGAAQQQDRGRAMRENAGAQDRAVDNGPRSPRLNPNAVTPGQPSPQASEREIRAGQVDRQSQQQPDQRRVPRNETQEYRSAPVERAPQVDAREQQRQLQQQREQQQSQQREMQQREQQQSQQREQQQRQDQQRAFQQQREQQQSQQREMQQREQQQSQQREQQQRQDQQRAFQQQREQQQSQQREMQQREQQQRQDQQRAFQQQQSQQREVQQREQQQSQQREQQQRAFQQQREQQQSQQREVQQRAYQEQQQQRQVQQQQMQQREQQAPQRQQQQQPPQQQQQQQGRRSRDKDQQDDRGHR